ncbi:MAG: SRPBCC domain-containing protein [Bacteroides sp.]|nr:SRPBCC domain-containing protein [Bacteroides sp.]
MKEIRTQISIKAAPEKIWNILMDFEGYSAWNPFITSIKGEKKPGEKLDVTIHPPEAKAMRFKPRVLTLTQNKELRWSGKMIASFMFQGEHFFILQPNERGTTDFIHGEKFSGITVPLMKKMLEKTREGFELMNQELKLVSERP